MHVLSSLEEFASDVEARSSPPDAVVVARTSDHELIDRACRWLGLPSEAAQRVPWTAVRPGAFTVGDVCVVSMAVARPDASMVPVRVVAGTGGMLLVAPEGEVLDTILDEVAPAESPMAALARLVVTVGQVSEDNLAAFADRVQESWDTRVAILTRAQRYEAMSFRRTLLVVNGIFAAQGRMLDDDGDVAQYVGPGSARQLAGARHRFVYVSDTANRLYAAAGDELSQQSTLVTEQLTIVNTVFLPLTLGASFFGMNFGWLTGHIESPTSFVLLGIALPAVLAALTVLAMRSLRRRTTQPGA